MSAWISLSLLLGGCAHEAKSLVRGDAEAARRQAESVIRDAQAEAGALRAEMAATRIHAAKREAELEELRAQVSELRRAMEAKQTELAALRSEREQLVQMKGDLLAQATTSHLETSSQTRLQDLEAAVAKLTAELAELKKISIPVASKAVLGAVWLPGEGASNMRITVQPGDSLWVLAQRYGLTVKRLKAANGLTGDKILAGQQLLVPAPPH